MLPPCSYRCSISGNISFGEHSVIPNLIHKAFRLLFCNQLSLTKPVSKSPGILTPPELGRKIEALRLRTHFESFPSSGMMSNFSTKFIVGGFRRSFRRTSQTLVCQSSSLRSSDFQRDASLLSRSSFNLDRKSGSTVIFLVPSCLMTGRSSSGSYFSEMYAVFPEERSTSKGTEFRSRNILVTILTWPGSHSFNVSLARETKFFVARISFTRVLCSSPQNSCVLLVVGIYLTQLYLNVGCCRKPSFLMARRKVFTISWRSRIFHGHFLTSSRFAVVMKSD